MHEAIDVEGRSLQITVGQVSKTLWTVSGTVAGSPITVSAASRRTAVNRWRKAAETRI